MEWKEYGGIVAVANSLRKYYGLEQFHDSDCDVDTWLRDNQFQTVVLILVDAFGSSVIDQHVSMSHPVMQYRKKDISTVFPPTTTAATTSLRTGRYPVENGWLGWNQYFSEYDDNIILFLKKSQYKNALYPEIQSKLPVPYITDELSEKGIHVEEVWPAFSNLHPCNTFEEQVECIGELIKSDKCQFIYCYWDGFDTYMHRNGPDYAGTKEYANQICDSLLKLQNMISDDTGVIVLADHSQISIRQENISPEITSLLRHEPALEPRTIAFYVKEDQHCTFEQLFKKLYGNDMDLYTKEEVIARKIFGEGEPAERFDEFTGDYLAVAKTDLQLVYKRPFGTKGDHAGGIKEEAMVPLFLLSHKEQ